MAVYHLERVIGVHPNLAALALYLHFRGENDWKIVSGNRSLEEQHEDFLKGRDPSTLTVIDASAVVTDADSGQSPHNWGLAIDLQPTYDKGATVSTRDDDPAYKELDALAPKFGLQRITLPSTGRVDGPHVQVQDWLTKKDWVTKMAVVVGAVLLVSALVTYA